MKEGRRSLEEWNERMEGGERGERRGERERVKEGGRAEVEDGG